MPCNAKNSRRTRPHNAIRNIAVFLLLCWHLPFTGAAELAIRVLYVGATDSSAFRGVEQGLSEAQTQGQFLGQAYDLIPFDDAGDLAAPQASAVIAAVPAIRLVHLAKKHPELPVFNVSAREDELRALCAGNLLHVIPSDAMLADAQRQWLRKSPGSAATARAWHGAFEKYAAAQLNMRYRKRFGEIMDDEAWAGWAAMKLLSDMAAREQTAAPGQLLLAIKTKLAFDGQKGTDLSFRETGQLRQPLLLVENDRLVGEAPVSGIVDAHNLDSLGLADCPK